MSLARFGPVLPVPGGLQRAALHHRKRPGERRFGRARIRLIDPVDQPIHSPVLSADFKLFAGTFLAGFLFVSVLIS